MESKHRAAQDETQAKKQNEQAPNPAASADVEKNSCASDRHCPAPCVRARCYAEEAAGLWEAGSNSLGLRTRMC